mmetsp:Transcript_24110/g.77764  ORF Transcript_24110/g.77764 Transcript_24110/m.77764 type:complete len:99 (+) Transcript_24110:43-339(+)
MCSSQRRGRSAREPAAAVALASQTGKTGLLHVGLAGAARIESNREGQNQDFFGVGSPTRFFATGLYFFCFCWLLLLLAMETALPSGGDEDCFFFMATR